MLIILAMLAGAGAAPTEADERASKMAALYDEVCLKSFPNDAAVDAAMDARGARKLPQDEVKVTFGDDPGRAWEIKDGSATVWLELPPYHACSVRWNSPDIPDFGAYRAIADRYEAQLGGYSAVGPWDSDVGDIHIHAVGEQRKRPDGGYESLFIFEQHITDPKRRAAGETGHSLRFVHQFAPPEPPAATPTT